MLIVREEQIRQEIERLRTEPDNEREKNFRLEMELGFVRIQISAENNDVTATENCSFCTWIRNCFMLKNVFLKNREVLVICS